MKKTAGHTCILFADVCGSTRLYEKLGNEKAQEGISRCLQGLSDITGNHHGRVIKTGGDDIMACFSQANQGFLASCEMQNFVEKGMPNVVAGWKNLAIHIGMHFGPVVFASDDAFGDAVNVAARLEKVAQARQIVTTHEMVQELSPTLQEKVRMYDRVRVVGREQEVSIYQVLWEDKSADLTRMSPEGFQQNAAPKSALSLHLRYRNQQHVLDASSSSLSFGRGEDCDISTDDVMASRKHLMLEHHRGKFVVQDQSTNGTYVLIEGGQEQYLRRESTVLFGRGRISPGRSSVSQNQDTESKTDNMWIHFHCF